MPNYPFRVRKIVFLGLTIALGLLFFQGVRASEINPRRVVQLVNGSRKVAGLEILFENQKLSQAAQAKAGDMLGRGYFSHNSPEGKTPWYWIERSGYDYKYAGENLAINFESAETQHQEWLESNDHRKNILSPRFQEIGVGVARGMFNGKPTVITVQLFGLAQKTVGELASGQTEGKWRELMKDNYFEIIPSTKSGVLLESVGPGKLIQSKVGVADKAVIFSERMANYFYWDRQSLRNIGYFSLILILLGSVVGSPLVVWVAYFKREINFHRQRKIASVG